MNLIMEFLLNYRKPCKDKSLAEDEVLRLLSTPNTVKSLYNSGILSIDLVPFKATPLALTAPFHQSCRSHIGIARKKLFSE